jgi:predicted O-methyltransferase YrrM
VKEHLIDEGKVAKTELDLDVGWRIGETAFSVLVADLQSLSPSRIVEFGSGASSVRLAQEFPHTHILSIDHSPEFLNETEALKNKFVPNSNLELSLRPLTWQRYGLSWYFSYAPSKLPEPLDAIIIDGPPFYTRRGREACLYQSINNLRVGGKVYLDDVWRRHEKQIFANWLASFPRCFTQNIFTVGHHIGILEKIESCCTRKNAFHAVKDASEQSLLLIRDRIKSRFE